MISEDSCYYYLEGKTPKPIKDAIEWARAFEDSNRIVAQDHIGEAFVSTCFLGLDHNFFKNGAPILFETMIFGGPHNDYQSRYSTWDKAEEGHKRACEMVKGAQIKTPT